MPAGTESPFATINPRFRKLLGSPYQSDPNAPAGAGAAPAGNAPDQSFAGGSTGASPATPSWLAPLLAGGGNKAIDPNRPAWLQQPQIGPSPNSSFNIPAPAPDKTALAWQQANARTAAVAKSRAAAPGAGTGLAPGQQWGYTGPNSGHMSMLPGQLNNSSQAAAIAGGAGQYGWRDSGMGGGGANSGQAVGNIAGSIPGGQRVVNNPAAVPAGGFNFGGGAGGSGPGGAAGAGGAGGPAGAGGGSLGAIAQNLQNQANAKNEQRYQQLLGLSGQLSGAQSAREDKSRAWQLGRADQQLISSGLGNSTVVPNVERGIIDDSNLRQQSIADQGIRNAMGIVERRTDQAPDLGLLASVAQRPGASGLAVGGGASFVGGGGGGGSTAGRGFSNLRMPPPDTRGSGLQGSYTPTGGPSNPRYTALMNLMGANAANSDGEQAANDFANNWMNPDTMDDPTMDDWINSIYGTVG